MSIYQLLPYPFVNASRDALNALAMKENADAKSLNRVMIAWFDKQPLSNGNLDKNPKFSPLYDEKLNRSGVPTRVQLYHGVTHKFFGMSSMVPEAK